MNVQASELDAAAMARLLVEYGQRLELAGKNPYQARAYQRAAQSLLSLTIPLGDVIAQGRLREIPGVGPALSETIFRLYTTGSHPTLDRLREEVPSSVLAMLRVPGLPPEKVLRLYRDLGIATLEELEGAAREDRLARQKRFGPALQEKILQGIELMRRSQGQRLIHHASDLLATVAENLKRSRPELSRILPAGDVRRGCELASEFALLAQVPKSLDTGTITLPSGIALHLAHRDHYGSALLFATGSAEHLKQLQALAGTKGLTLSTEGLRRGKDVIASRTEKKIYAALGLPLIEPELREGWGEVQRAAARSLPRLVRASDLRGLLHCHTNFSDGGDTLEEMAEATRERGYSYFGVADHSQSARYARGLKPEEIDAQHGLADALNRRYGDEFRILKGIESDILADGSLDYPDEVLSRFDFVVASVHSRFRLDSEAQTLRIISAVANPHTTILGHMTGRLLLRRPGYEIDVEAILRACAQHEVAVEVNANPHRLDLDWRWLQRAVEFGCLISINPDAHSVDELDLTHWGVLMARKGTVPKERVVNCMSLAALTEFLKSRRQRLSRGAGGGGRARARDASTSSRCP